MFHDESLRTDRGASVIDTELFGEQEEHDQCHLILIIQWVSVFGWLMCYAMYLRDILGLGCRWMFSTCCGAGLRRTFRGSNMVLNYSNTVLSSTDTSLMCPYFCELLLTNFHTLMSWLDTVSHAFLIAQIMAEKIRQKIWSPSSCNVASEICARFGDCRPHLPQPIKEGQCSVPRNHLSDSHGYITTTKIRQMKCDGGSGNNRWSDAKLQVWDKSRNICCTVLIGYCGYEGTTVYKGQCFMRQ